MARNNLYNDMLTPSAKEALNETMNELQELLVTKANSIAQKGQTADKEISLRDILEAKESLFKAKIIREKSENRRRKIVGLATITGSLYSIAGILIYLFQNQELVLKNNWGLIIAFVGVILTLLSIAYSQIILKRSTDTRNLADSNVNYLENNYDIIKRWQIIEKLGSNLMRQKGFSNNESKSINEILKFLSSELKSDKLYMDMRDLLSIRNKILHEEYDLSKQEKQSYLHRADKIIELLETLEK